MISLCWLIFHNPGLLNLRLSFSWAIPFTGSFSRTCIYNPGLLYFRMCFSRAIPWRRTYTSQNLLRFAQTDFSIDPQLQATLGCSSIKNPAVPARFCDVRRERDSNPRSPWKDNGFRDRPVRPLRHLSIPLRTLDDLLSKLSNIPSSYWIIYYLFVNQLSETNFIVLRLAVKLLYRI